MRLNSYAFEHCSSNLLRSVVTFFILTGSPKKFRRFHTDGLHTAWCPVPCPVPSLRAPGCRCPREQTCPIRRPVMVATDQMLACSAWTCVLPSSGWLDGIRRRAQAEAQGSGIKKMVAILLASYLFLCLVSSISVSLAFALHSPPTDLTFLLAVHLGLTAPTW